MSEVVTSGQVMGSIVMFGLIYLLLGVLWIIVLNKKIQHGPDPPSSEKSGDDLTAARGALLDGPGPTTETRGA